MRGFTHEVELLGQMRANSATTSRGPHALAVGPEALDEASTGVH